MQLVKSIRQMQKISQNWRQAGHTLALVPTMGNLHAGHQSLIKLAHRHGDKVLVSIFVNPTQFGSNEDYKKYPRTLAADLKRLRAAKVDVVFFPSAQQVYPQNFQTSVELGQITRPLCAPFRPGHFAGVATIVLKLFNITQPHVAIFGKKDYQQLLLVKQMVQDLALNVKIVAGKTVREKDGLAKSSRNRYLSPRERVAAARIYLALGLAKKLLSQRLKNHRQVQAKVWSFLAEDKLIKPQYVEVLDAKNLEPLKQLRGRVLVALAVRVGKTRLIDNVEVDVGK